MRGSTTGRAGPGTTPFTRVWRSAVALVLLAAVALPAAPAEAAFPGTNGLIAFVRQADGSTAKEIHTIAPDGTLLRNLSNPTNAPCVSVECRRDEWPSFSSDGKKIAFASNRHDQEAGANGN
jgi:hypothetical protein